MSERVMAHLSVEYPYMSCEHILDNWTEQEVDELLSGNLEALEALGSDLQEDGEPDERYVTLNRPELEDYLAARKRKAARS